MDGAGFSFDVNVIAFVDLKCRARSRLQINKLKKRTSY